MMFTRLNESVISFSSGGKCWRALRTTTPSTIGFTGLSESSGDLTWTDDIADAAGYSTSTEGDYVSVSSPLDNMFPYNELEEFTDSEGNVFVKFPKCYIKFIDNADGHVDGFKVSKIRAEDDMFIPDCFLNPADGGATYLDYCALGKYEASGTKEKLYSKSGAACLVREGLDNQNAAVRSYGTTENYYNGYQLLDMSMVTLYNFLCMLYYKTANIQKVYSGRVGFSTHTPANTGTCDGVNGQNGWNTGTTCVKMLGIENPYGNVAIAVCDTYCHFSSSGIATPYVYRLPHATTESLSLGFELDVYDRQYISKLKHGITPETRSYVYPHEQKGSADTYVGDYIRITDTSCRYPHVGGWSISGTTAGLWSLYCYWSYNATTNICGRLCYRPVQ